MYIYSLPEEFEPRMEEWLSKRGIPFEVGISKKPGILRMLVYFQACTDEKERQRIREMFENNVKKIPGGKILKDKTREKHTPVNG